MDDLVRSGKTLYHGINECPAEGIENAGRIAREMNECPRSVQAEEYAAAVDVSLPDETPREIDALSPAERFQ